MTAELASSPEVNARFIDYVVENLGRYSLGGSDVKVWIDVEDVPVITMRETTSDDGLQLARVVSYEYDTSVQSVLLRSDLVTAEERVQEEADDIVRKATIQQAMVDGDMTELEEYYYQAISMLRQPVVGDILAEKVMDAVKNKDTDTGNDIERSARDEEVLGLLEALKLATPK